MEPRQEAEAALECPICADLLRNASETACGHAFCEFCINRCLETSTSCPVCRKECLPVHPSFALRSLVHTLHPERTRTRLKPLSAEEERQEGNEFFRRNEFAEAIEHYNAAVELDPHCAAAFSNRALCLMKTHQTTLALEDCERAIHCDVNFVKAHVRKAQCLQIEGKLQQSIDALETAKRLDKAHTFSADIERIEQAIGSARAVPPRNGRHGSVDARNPQGGFEGAFETFFASVQQQNDELLRGRARASTGVPHAQPQHRQQQPQPQPQQPQQQQQRQTEQQQRGNTKTGPLQRFRDFIHKRH